MSLAEQQQQSLSVLVVEQLIKNSGRDVNQTHDL